MHSDESLAAPASRDYVAQWLCKAEPFMLPRMRRRNSLAILSFNWTILQESAIREFAIMSVFDALGAAAAILQFVNCGVKLGVRAIAIYEGRGELADLQTETRKFQQRNEEFKATLHLRSPNPSSGEALLISIADDCHSKATDLADLLTELLSEAQGKSKVTAIKVAFKAELKKNKREISGKRAELEALRQQCHEQLGVIIR